MPDTIATIAATCSLLPSRRPGLSVSTTGRNLVAVAEDEGRRLGHRQVYACRGHRVQRPEALCQFAFQPMAEAHVLPELADPERIIAVDHFQAARQLGHHVLGHQHLATVRMQAIGDAFGIEHRHCIGGDDLLLRAEPQENLYRRRSELPGRSSDSGRSGKMAASSVRRPGARAGPRSPGPLIAINRTCPSCGSPAGT